MTVRASHLQICLIASLLFGCAEEDTATYQGKTAAEWAALADDKDKATAEEAWQALEALYDDSKTARRKFDKQFDNAYSEYQGYIDELGGLDTVFVEEIDIDSHLIDFNQLTEMRGADYETLANFVADLKASFAKYEDRLRLRLKAKGESDEVVECAIEDMYKWLEKYVEDPLDELALRRYEVSDKARKRCDEIFDSGVAQLEARIEKFGGYEKLAYANYSAANLIRGRFSDLAEMPSADYEVLKQIALNYADALESGEEQARASLVDKGLGDYAIETWIADANAKFKVYILGPMLE